MACSMIKTMLFLLAATTAQAQQLVVRESRYGQPICTGTQVFYKTPAPGRVFIHFNDGNGWTKAPGVEMQLSNDIRWLGGKDGWYAYETDKKNLEFVFVTVTEDGAWHWDNNNNQNYHAQNCGGWAVMNLGYSNPMQDYKGVYHFDEKAGHFFYDSGLTRVYYKAKSAPFVSYRVQTGEWTPSPVQMAASADYSGYFQSRFGWFQFEFNSSNVELSFTDGNGVWDNNSGKNYTLVEGGVYGFLPQLLLE